MLTLLRRPGLAWRFLAVLLSAVPIGMLPLALVVDGLDRTGQAGAAGLLASALALGSAAGVLGQGALLVRVRAALLLPVCGVAGVAGAALVAAVPPSGTGLVVATAAAALTGATIPAVTTAVRGRLVAVLPEGRDRVRAYAALNVLFQAGLALGPVLAAVLAVVGAVRLAAPIAAALGLLAAVVVARVDRAAPAPGRERLPATAAGTRRSGLPVLLAVAGAAGIGTGALQVSIPAAHPALPAVAGIAFAALALGEVAGALVLGGRVAPSSARRALRLGLVGMAAVYGAAALGLAPAVVVVLTGGLGLATAAQSIGSAVLLDRVVPAHLVTAAFAAQVATMLVGTSLGALAAGAVGAPVVLLAPAVLLAAAAVAAGVLSRPTLPARGTRKRSGALV